MKTYVYARVSTEQQDLAQQLNAIDNYLKMRGLQIDELVSDEGVSGGVSYKQRKLNDLLQEMEAGDALVVSEISRLGRSMSDLNKLVNDELKPRKLRLIVISMGMDLDCGNLKAIDEMILFAFGFSAQIEKEMIQERTRNALEARKKLIKEQGYFISKSGNKRVSLGGGTMEQARVQSAINRRKNAQKNESNVRVWRYLQSWESRNEKLTSNTSKVVFEELATMLNELEYKTPTGLEFTGIRLRAMWTKLKDLYVYEK